MADPTPPTPTVTITLPGTQIEGTEMVFDGESYIVAGNLHIKVAGKIVIECAEATVIQNGG